MPDKKPTDSEIVKALEYWQQFDKGIDDMLSGRLKGNKMLLEQKEIVKTTLNLFDLINRLQARVEKSEKVEHFADKTIATLQAENERLKEIKKGKWIDKCVRDWRCSKCGCDIQKIRKVDGYCYDDLPNYCPDCGAEMREN